MNAISIKKFGRCEILQDVPGAYRVMSSNNICLFESVSPASAMEYAEWFERNYVAIPKVIQPDPFPLPGYHFHPGDEA